MHRPQRFSLVLVIISVFTLALFYVLFFSSPQSLAQTQSQLVPLVTDQTPLALSNQFGAASLSTVNQSGDYAFVGNASTAVYYRSAGAGSPTTVLQMGDEVPGFAGSRHDLTTQIRLNNAGVLLLRLDFAQATGVLQGAIFTFDGASLQQVVAGADLAPGGGGAPFGRNLGLGGINDSGDIAFTAPLIPGGSTLPAQTTLYIKPAGGAPVRVAGLGDSAPGTGGTFSTLGLLGFNNNGEQLFSSTIVGGSGGNALFIGDVNGVSKVVAQGDVNPSGGVFPAIGAAFINNAGDVVFQSGPAIYVNVPGTGISRVAAAGDAVPAPVGGTTGAPVLQSFGDASDVVFNASIAGSAVSTTGLFRRRSTNPIEIVAYRNQAVPGAPGQTFSTSFTGSSVNNTGVVSFRATLLGGPALNGVFQQTGTNAPVNIARDGQATTLSGGGTYSLITTSPVTVSLNNGAVFFRSDVAGGTADYGEFLNSAGAISNLMNTGDALPPGSRVVLRTFRVGGSGDSVGFIAQHTGGRSSIVVHSIANQSSNVLVSDGDAAPGTGGGIIRLVNRNTVFQNSSGTMVFSAQIIGGSTPSNTGLFVRTPGGVLTKIVANGDVDPGSGKTFSVTSISAVTPSPINDAGQVVFITTLVPVSGPSTRTIFVWSPGTGLTKIAGVGDLTFSSGPITSFPGLNQLSINSSGQVAFVATTAGGPAGILTILVGSGGPPAKVVAAGDPGPAGSTFLNFLTPGFNDSGELAFVATLTGGPGGGVFLGSTSGAPVPLALNGAAAPAGGNFSITTARPDAVINNQHDVVFRSSLTGGTADSGYFVRRGAGGTLQAVVLQGDAAPGTSGVFDTITLGLNNLISENFQIGPDGDIAFQNFFLEGGQRTIGTWHVRTDNVIEEMLVRGTVAPEFGDGTVVSSTPSTAWNTGGRYALWGRVSGGTYTDGIFLFVPTVSTNTPPGDDVPVSVVDGTTGTTPVNLIFDNVTQAGETTLTTASGGPAIPTAFALGDPPVFYNLETTAIFSGSINICIDFSNISFPPGAPLRLLHYEGGAWVDVTTSGPSGNVICGSVTSLSPFTVVQVLNQPPTADAGANQIVECTSSSGCTFTLNGTGSSDPDHDALTYVWKDSSDNVVGNTASVVVTRPLGTYTFTLTVNDSFNPSSTDSTQVTVRDTTPPALAVSMSPNEIWPANKKMVTVTANIDLSDLCDASPQVVLVSITCNETLGAGDIEGATYNTDDRSFQLRATRAGNGPGRIYTITYQATDASGNSTNKTAQVIVPHDQGH